jgi:hypothetical protein
MEGIPSMLDGLSTTKKYDAAAPQPKPGGGDIDVAVVAAERLKALGLGEIAEDIEARIRLGERKYGTRLKAFNGRSALLDLLQESLDAINYSMQCQIEGLDDGTLFSRFVELTVLIKDKLDGQGE